MSNLPSIDVFAYHAPLVVELLGTLSKYRPNEYNFAVKHEPLHAHKIPATILLYRVEEYPGGRPVAAITRIPYDDMKIVRTSDTDLSGTQILIGSPTVNDALESMVRILGQKCEGWMHTYRQRQGGIAHLFFPVEHRQQPHGL